MERIDHLTKAEDLFGAGKDGFTEGDPETEVPATTLTAAFANAVQEELANAVELFTSLTPGLRNQLATGLLTLADLVALSNVRVFDSARSDWSDAAASELGSGVSPASLVLVNQNNDILTSIDGGVTWTQSLLIDPTSAGALSVAFHGDKFVAVGPSGGIYTAQHNSPDVFTQRSPATSYSQSFRYVRYSSVLGLWIALGDARSATAGSPYELQTSPDGVTWTARVLPARTRASQNALTFTCGIAEIAGRAVVVMEENIYSSADAITWSAVSYDHAPTAGTRFDGAAVTPIGLLVPSGENATGGKKYAWLSLDGSSFARIPVYEGIPCGGRSGLLFTRSSLGVSVVLPPYDQQARLVVVGATSSNDKLYRFTHYWLAIHNDLIRTAGPLGF